LQAVSSRLNIFPLLNVTFFAGLNVIAVEAVYSGQGECEAGFRIALNLVGNGIFGVCTWGE
jgi:hypothetical protein